MSEQGPGMIVDTATGEVMSPAATKAPLAKVETGEVMGFGSAAGFALLQRAATMLAACSLVPKEYQGNVPNCAVAINMALRIGADPLMVTQNLYVVHGRPGWSAQFLIASFNQCGRFSAIRYEFVGQAGTLGRGCRAWAVEKSTGERLEGTLITLEMAKAEGWSTKAGSKWLTMPEQMLRYRAAAWLVRAYAPEIAMGLQTAEELADVVETVQVAPGVYQAEGRPVKPGEGGALDQLAEKLGPLAAKLDKLADAASVEADREAAILAVKAGLGA